MISRVLLLLLLILLPQGHVALHVLLFGDSIDRQTVYEWCMLQFRRQKLLESSSTNQIKMDIRYEEWGTSSLKYFGGQGRMATLYCRISYQYPDHQRFPPKNFSLAFVHMFGSPAYGPYLNYISNGSDPYADTILRLPHALGIYHKTYEQFPDVISIQFANWDRGRYDRNFDSKELIPGTSLWNNVLDDFRQNHHERIKQVQDLIRNYTSSLPSENDIATNSPDFSPSKLSQQKHYSSRPELILRTAVTSIVGGELIIEFNRIIKDLAKEYQLRLFDYHDDIWSTMDYQYGETGERALFRDKIHPKQYYTAIGGEKLLNLRYTAAWKFPTSANATTISHMTSNHYRNWKRRFAAMIKCKDCFKVHDSEKEDRIHVGNGVGRGEGGKSRSGRVRRRKLSMNLELSNASTQMIEYEANQIIPYVQSIVLIGFLREDYHTTRHHLHPYNSSAASSSSLLDPHHNERFHLPLSAYSKIYLYRQDNQTLHWVMNLFPVLGALRLGVCDIFPIYSEKDQQVILQHIKIGAPFPSFGISSPLQSTIFQVLSPSAETTQMSSQGTSSENLPPKQLQTWFYHYHRVWVRAIRNQYTLDLLTRVNRPHRLRAAVIDESAATDVAAPSSSSSSTPSSLYVDVDQYFFDYVPPPYLLDETPLPDLEKMAVRSRSVIQYHKEKTVYFLDEKLQRHIVQNMAELSRYISNTTGVVLMEQPEDIVIFPPA